MTDHEYKLASTEHLRGQRLEFKRYTRWSEAWDHDHCRGCWAEFMEDAPDALHEGWTTTDEYSHGAEYEWLCAACFEEVREVHGLRVASPRG